VEDQLDRIELWSSSRKRQINYMQRLSVDYCIPQYVRGHVRLGFIVNGCPVTDQDIPPLEPSNTYQEFEKGNVGRGVAVLFTNDPVDWMGFFRIRRDDGDQVEGLTEISCYVDATNSTGKRTCTDSLLYTVIVDYVLLIQPMKLEMVGKLLQDLQEFVVRGNVLRLVFIQRNKVGFTKGTTMGKSLLEEVRNQLV
jgi:hypothetical protein